MNRNVCCRSALSALLLMLAMPLLPARECLEFDVQLDGKPIGTHRFELSVSGDGAQRIESEAEFRYQLLGIPFYRYRHRATEHWVDGCLQRIEASTDDNGNQLRVRGDVRAGRFLLEHPAPVQSRADCVSAYAYWNRDRLLAQRELLNPQTGRFDAVRFETLGVEERQVRGARQPAERIRLLGDNLQIDLWYSLEGEWLELQSKVESGRTLRYLRRH